MEMKKNKLTIIDLVKIVPWDDVKRALKYHYPEDRNNYSSVYQKISKMENVPLKYGKEVLEIATHGDPSNFPEHYSNKEMAEDVFYDTHTKRPKEKFSYSLSFRPWVESASIPIDKETLNHLKYEEIIAHFIWEITYYGNEEEMEKAGDEILERGKQAIKEAKEGKYTVC